MSILDLDEPLFGFGPTYNSGESVELADWVKIYVPKLAVWHHGIVREMFPWNGGTGVRIAHNRKETGVAVSDWYEFADGNVVVLERRADSALHVQQICARVDANIGKPYRLFNQNCEHFASFCFTEKAESKSLQIVVGSIAAIGILAALVSNG